MTPQCVGETLVSFKLRRQPLSRLGMAVVLKEEPHRPATLVPLPVAVGLDETLAPACAANLRPPQAQAGVLSPPRLAHERGEEPVHAHEVREALAAGKHECSVLPPEALDLLSPLGRHDRRAELVEDVVVRR